METFLIAQRGEEIGRRYDLDAAQLTVGRGADNDMVLNDPMVSRYHAVVKRQGDGFTITDLGSANPVAVNDEALEPGIPRQLRHRDVLFIGRTVFSFQSRERPQPARRDQEPPRPAVGPDPEPTGATRITAALAAPPYDMGVPSPLATGRPTPPPDFPTPPPPAPRAGDDDFQTDPGPLPPVPALPPLPPLRAGEPDEDGEGETTIGMPPDDERGDSTTVFIPRERR